MTVSTQLAAAIDVFVELGWASATFAEAEMLPLGTSEQRRIARTGLSSGAWGGFAEVAADHYGWTSWIGVDHTMLALFALRVGVNAPRVARLLAGSTAVDDPLLTRLLAARGPAFAKALAQSPRWAPVHAVQLVDLHDLPVPDDVAYLEEWSRLALDALDDVDESLRPTTRRCDSAVVLRRVPAHVRAGVAAGLPATVTFGRVVTVALRRGLLDRDEMLDLMITALDSAQRPGDRKVWAQVLTEVVGATDEELVARADALVGILTHGDSPVVEVLAPRLIAGVRDDLLGDILAITLLIRTKKTLRLLLASAALRPQPSPDVIDAVSPLVLPLTTSTDRTLARAAGALAERWKLTIEAPTDESRVHGLWHPTPPVWQVPKFTVGEATAARLTEAAATLIGRPDGIVDIETERFLALANTVARADVAAARTALGGVRPTWIGGLRCIPSWLTGSPNPLLDRGTDPRRSELHLQIWAPAEAREGAVVSRLGEVPVLLSSPTWEDLRVDPADLVARLADYLAAEATATEADLFLAMTRVDLTLITDQILAALDSLTVPILLQSGDTALDTAGPLLRRYLSDPVREPLLALDGRRHGWSLAAVVTPTALGMLPRRVSPPRGYYSPGPEDFPTWGDAATRNIHFSEESGIGLELRQVARRGTPLTPGLAVNLIGAQRSFHPTAAADGTLAVREAWERGLLRPGVADIQFLDWSETPSALAAFARSCEELVRDGMLALVWPLLDDLLLASLRAPRMLAGTAKVIEVLETFVPEVEAALFSGLADPTSLALPGVRAVAARAGSSRAVKAARRIITRLPASVGNPAPALLTRPTHRFEDVWAPDAGTRPAVEDGATLTARWVDPTVPGKLLAIDLTLPGLPITQLRVVKSWFYDLENEGQCAASAAGPSGRHRPDSWLRWDPALSKLVLSSTRNWPEGNNRPLSSSDPVPPLTTSMTAVLLASLCHTQTTAARSAAFSMKKIISRGRVGSAAVSSAMQALLPHADVSPARMVSLMESDPTTLPVLWPILTKSVTYAAQVDGPTPRWLNRVLDVTLLHADLLRDAGQRELLPSGATSWAGLRNLAERPGKSAVQTKARTLINRLTP